MAGPWREPPLANRYFSGFFASMEQGEKRVPLQALVSPLWSHHIDIYLLELS